MGIGHQLDGLVRVVIRRDITRAKSLAPMMRLIASARRNAVAEALDRQAPWAAAEIYVDGGVYHAAATAALVAVVAATLHRISAKRALAALPAIQAGILGMKDEQVTVMFRAAIQLVGRAEMQDPRDGSFIVPAAADFLFQTLCATEEVALAQREQALAGISLALPWPLTWWG
jgi:hypothetical protein